MRIKHKGSVVNHGHMKRSAKARIRTRTLKTARSMKSKGFLVWQFMKGLRRSWR